MVKPIYEQFLSRNDKEVQKGKLHSKIMDLGMNTINIGTTVHQLKCLLQVHQHSKLT